MLFLVCGVNAPAKALAVMNQQAATAEPPWPKDLTQTIASFLSPVDALALDISGSATRCVMVERNVNSIAGRRFPARSGPDEELRPHRFFRVELGACAPLRAGETRAQRIVGAPRPRVHTVVITFAWRANVWEESGYNAMVSVVREGGRAPNFEASWSTDVVCGKEPAPRTRTRDSMEFRPRSGEEYDFWFRVAEGTHLEICGLRVHRLRYR